jgi:dynein heavy chain
MLQIQLQDLMLLVRGKLSNQSRITLGALVVLDMHAKDVVEDLLNNRVHSDLDFKWLAQLR